MYYHPESYVFLDGSFIKASEAKGGLFDQSMHYGNAAFEGIRAYHTPQGTQIFKAKEHYDRLKNSAYRMFMEIPYYTDELISLTYQLLEKNHLSSAYIRPLIFAGPNMELNGAGKVSVMIAAWEWGNYLGNDPLNIMISSFQRPHPQAFFMDAKIAGHYVNSILANTEAKQKGFDDALLLDWQGNLSEGSAANFFFEKDKRLYTSPEGNILLGITRATVIEIAEEMGIEVIEKESKPDELLDADGAFFTSTAIEISGIQSVNRKPFRKSWEKSLGYQIEHKYKQRVLLNEYENYAII